MAYRTNYERLSGQMANLRFKRYATERFTVQRESGSDWSVFDTRLKKSVATGLDFAEAEKTADEFNEGVTPQANDREAGPKQRRNAPLFETPREHANGCDLRALTEAVKSDGQLTILPPELSALLGLAGARDQAALLSVLETERPILLANGIRYFPHKHNHGAITFRMLSLDKTSYSATVLAELRP